METRFDKISFYLFSVGGKHIKGVNSLGVLLVSYHEMIHLLACPASPYTAVQTD
jgi:hypothetical protein